MARPPVFTIPPHTTRLHAAMPLRRGWAFALMAALMLSHAPPLCISSSNKIKSDGSITSSLPYLEELEALIQTVRPCTCWDLLGRGGTLAGI